MALTDFKICQCKLLNSILVQDLSVKPGGSVYCFGLGMNKFNQKFV